ncbi:MULTISPECIES: hypothetical protein [Haloarcula]|uniref:hypothetical protein n=1 Tax=Haloarcula TaxID=2237 RepID=UPI0023EAC916|nr:hypothetical protein [Halomicroarcula sp. XH51]
MISDNKTATVSANGILVERTLSVEDGWVVGTIQVESISQRRDVVHVVEELPDDLPVESVGFKRDDPPSDGEITCERVSVRLPVEGDAVSVDFGIELADPVSDVAFEEPRIERVDAADPSDSVAQTDGGENPAAQTDGDAPTARPQSADGSGATGDTDAPEGAGGAPPSASAGGQQGVSVSSTSVKDVIRGTDADDSEEEDGTGEATQGQSPRRSVEARLDYLSSRVDEFAAYTTALESFLDEQGTAQEFIDRIDEEVAELGTAVEAVSEEVDAVRETNQDLGDELRRRTDDLEARIEDAHGSLEDDLDDVRTRLDDDVARLDGSLDDQAEDLDSLRADYEALEARVSDIEAEIERNAETVDSVEASVSDVADDVDVLRAEVETLRGDVEGLSEFRASLADAFGGSAGPATPAEE